MPRFRFPLEPLLEMRRREEDLRKRELAALEQQRRSMEDDLRRKQDDLTSGKTALRAGLVGVLDATILRQQAAATIAVDRHARCTVLELAGLLQRIAAARKLLLNASQRRRAVEILRERRLEEWTYTENRKETALLDEFASNASTRAAMAALREESEP